MATSSNRPYQGYPYIDPPVTDVSSISADDAARWHHLPRRQLELNVKRAPPDAEVIDFQPRSSRSSFKKDPDTPVVYVDLPDADGSDVTKSRGHTHEEAAFASYEKIFYDPFENRRIDRAKSEESDDSEVSSIDRQRLPRRPNNLDLNGAGPSAGPSSNPSSSGMPSFMAKEAEIYGRRDGDFPASPIPVSQFPEPPPAYAEIDSVTSPTEELEPEPRPVSPPKTLVILPTDNTSPTPIELLNSDRKYLNCQHCGSTVHSLVVQENGSLTHATACFCLLIGCIPAIILIYCTDYLKARNHYCPNCNKVIGYQQPFGSERVVYVNES